MAKYYSTRVLDNTRVRTRVLVRTRSTVLMGPVALYYIGRVLATTALWGLTAGKFDHSEIFRGPFPFC